MKVTTSIPQAAPILDSNSIEGITQLLKKPRNRPLAVTEVLSSEQLRIVDVYLAKAELGSREKYHYCWQLGAVLKKLKTSGTLEDLRKAPLSCHPQFSRETVACSMRP